MRYLLPFLLLAIGCNAPQAVNRADIIAALAVRYAAAIVNQGKQPAPIPDVPQEGCVDGCRCNGTGEEKSGDGLAVVPCRCEDDCECKAARAEPMPFAKESAGISSEEPPLVPIKSSSSCESGNCEQQQVGRRWRLFRK